MRQTSLCQGSRLAQCALIGSTECAGLGTLSDSGQLTGQGSEDSQVRELQFRTTSVACQISFEYFQRCRAERGRMPGQWVDVGARRLIVERVWIREVRRAARRATAPFARQVAWGCGAAAVGTIAASVLTLHLDGSMAQAVWAALWVVAVYLAIWAGLFIYHLCRYRSSGFRDHDWLARHDDSDPGGALFLELGRRSGASPKPGVDLELWVKSHGNWEVVADDDVVLMPDNVIRCRFDLHHEVFAGGFYDVRWFRADDRGKFIEITRERFQLRNHSIGRRTGSVSRSHPRLAPKALPISEHEIKPRRLAPEAVTNGEEISPRRAVEAR
jgi:hypothetical protein